MDELVRSVLRNDVEDLEFVLQYTNLDVNTPDSSGRLVLVEAIKIGNLDMIELILAESSLDINLGYKKLGGKTPIMLATLWQMDAVVDLLFSRKLREIDINKQDDKGNTALILAVESGNIALLHRILDHPDIDVNVSDNLGNSPFMRAAAEGKAAIVKIFLKRKDLAASAVNTEGLTALEIAKARKNMEIVAVLNKSPILFRTMSRQQSQLDTNIRTQAAISRTASLGGLSRTASVDSMVLPRRGSKEREKSRVDSGEPSHHPFSLDNLLKQSTPEVSGMKPPAYRSIRKFSKEVEDVSNPSELAPTHPSIAKLHEIDKLLAQSAAPKEEPKVETASEELSNTNTDIVPKVETEKSTSMEATKSSDKATDIEQTVEEVATEPQTQSGEVPKEQEQIQETPTKEIEETTQEQETEAVVEEKPKVEEVQVVAQENIETQEPVAPKVTMPKLLARKRMTNSSFGSKATSSASEETSVAEEIYDDKSKPAVVYTAVGSGAGKKLKAILNRVELNEQEMEVKFRSTDSYESLRDLLADLRHVSLFIVFTTEEYFAKEMMDDERLRFLTSLVWARRNHIKLVAWQPRGKGGNAYNRFQRLLDEEPELLDEDGWAQLNDKSILKPEVIAAVEALSKTTTASGAILRLVNKAVK